MAKRFVKKKEEGEAKKEETPVVYKKEAVVYKKEPEPFSKYQNAHADDVSAYVEKPIDNREAGVLEEMLRSPFAIPIRENALKKMFAYVELIPKVTGDDHKECYGHILALKDNKTGVIEDVILAEGQFASAGSCGQEPDAVYKSGKKIQESDYRKIGWWHSHHTLGAWFSGTDDRNIDDELSLTMAYKNIPGGQVKFAYGFTVSIVDGRRYYYAEIAYRKGHSKGRIKSAELILLPGGHEVDYVKIGAEIAQVLGKSWYKKIWPWEKKDKKPAVEFITKTPETEMIDPMPDWMLEPVKCGEVENNETKSSDKRRDEHAK